MSHRSILCVAVIATHIRAISRRAIIYFFRSEAPTFGPFRIPRSQFQTCRFVSRIATSSRRVSPDPPAHPPARANIGATCCFPMPFSVVPHVRDRVSERFSFSLSPYASPVFCLSRSLLCLAVLRVTISFRRFRSFLVIFSCLFPTSRER